MVFAWTWGMILNGCYKVIKVERPGLGINSSQEAVLTPWPCPELRKNQSTLWAPFLQRHSGHLGVLVNSVKRQKIQL